MARYIIDTFTSGSIPAGGSGEVHRTLSFNNINIYKIKVEPSATGLSSQVEIFKKDTLLAADLVYRSGDFTGDLVDTGEDSGSAITEREEGYVCPYEDSDNSLELHIKITNNDTAARSYDFTIVYEEAVSLFTARTLGNPALYTDLTDRDNWLPAYSTSEIMEWTENPDGTVTIGGAGSSSIAISSSYEIAAYIMSRFLIFPDSNGEIQVRAKFKDVNLWGTDYATRKSRALIGLHWVFGAQNDFQSLAFANSNTVDYRLLTRLYNDDQRSTIAFAEDYFVDNLVSPGIFTGELILAMGMNKTPSQSWYRFGVDQTQCGYSLDGGAITYFTAASSNQPPYCEANPGYMMGANIFCGLLFDEVTNGNNTLTIEEIEVIKGYTINVV